MFLDQMRREGRERDVFEEQRLGQRPEQSLKPRRDIDYDDRVETVFDHGACRRGCRAASISVASDNSSLRCAIVRAVRSASARGFEPFHPMTRRPRRPHRAAPRCAFHHRIKRHCVRHPEQPANAKAPRSRGQSAAVQCQIADATPRRTVARPTCRRRPIAARPQPCHTAPLTARNGFGACSAKASMNALPAA